MYLRVKPMRLVIVWLVTVVLAAAAGRTAQAEIIISVDKSAQRMTVNRDGQPLYNWPVSTGRNGYATPSGSFKAFRMEADHHSDEWDDAPMPYSIFFTKIGHAIHGSYDTKNLGKPASHGCVRLSPSNAATLFDLVQREGVTNTKVVLIGSEQVALRQRGANSLRDQDDVYESQLPSRNPNADYSRQDYSAPRYMNPNYDYARREYVQPRYVQPQYGQPYYRYPPGYGAD
jgi:hypothetical protein